MNREERKKEYLKCFIKTFSENGIDRTPVKKLAGAAKINEASIYQYFKNKDEIVVDCVKLYLEGELTQLCEVLSDQEEQLEVRIDRFLQLSGETSAQAKFIIQVLTSPIYGQMCSQMIHDFSRRFLTSPHMERDDDEFQAETEDCAIQLLFLSIAISDRVIGESNLLRMQVEYLLRLIYESHSRERAQRNSA